MSPQTERQFTSPIFLDFKANLSRSWAATDLRRAIDEMASQLIERFYPSEKKEAV